MGAVNTPRVRQKFGKIVNILSEGSKKKTRPVFQEIKLTKVGAEIAQETDGFEGYLVDITVDEFVYDNKKKQKFVFNFIDEDGRWKVDVGINTMSRGIINKLASLANQGTISDKLLRLSLWEGKPTPEFDRYSSNCTIRVGDSDETVKNAHTTDLIKKSYPVKEVIFNGETVYDLSEFNKGFFNLIEKVIKPKLNPDDCPIKVADLKGEPVSGAKQDEAPSFERPDVSEPYLASGSAPQTGGSAQASGFPVPSASFGSDEEDDLPF